jgi:dTMP kinase
VSKLSGIFITFEGGEGVGKSTHIRFVASYFHRHGRKVLVVREPGSTKIGEQIRAVLLNPKNRGMSVETELFLYLAARAQLVSEIIRPALQKGAVVISDRFEDSTIVYQGIAGGLIRDPLPASPIRKAWGRKFVSMLAPARGNVVPDLTFLLDLDPRIGLRRSGRKDRMEKKSLRFHERIRRGYLRLARKNPKRMVVIASGGSKRAVQMKIEEALDRRWKRN